MIETVVAYTDSLDRTTTQKFEDQGYVVVRGLLDEQEDIQPVREEYESLLDALTTRWDADGQLSSTFRDLPFEQRLAKVASEGVGYSDYFDICFTGNGGMMHRGPALFNLLRSPRLLNGVEHFIGPEIYSNPIQHTRIKVPKRMVPEQIRNDYNSRTPWHQDASLTNESDGVRFSFDLRYNPTDQPTGRSWFPGFVARSRSHPETELHDFEAWDRMCEQARRALEAIDYNTPGRSGWKTGEQDPRCA